MRRVMTELLIEIASFVRPRQRGCGALLLAVGLFASPVLSSRTHAQVANLGVTATNPGTRLGELFSLNRFTKGYVFTPNTDIFVTHLGFFDEGENGLGTGTRPVGLWTTNGTLLASVDVSSSASLGGFDDTTAAVKGDFRFVALLSPIKLNANTSYVIGANLNVADRWNKGNFVTAPQITVLGSSGRRKDNGNYTIAFPDIADGAPNARANFLFTTSLTPGEIAPYRRRRPRLQRGRRTDGRHARRERQQRSRRRRADLCLGAARRHGGDALGSPPRSSRPSTLRSLARRRDAHLRADRHGQWRERDRHGQRDRRQREPPAGGRCRRRPVGGRGLPGDAASARTASTSTTTRSPMRGCRSAAVPTVTLSGADTANPTFRARRRRQRGAPAWSPRWCSS